jgi:hypothetical protein
MEVRSRFSRIREGSPGETQCSRLGSWKEIALHFDRSEKTVRRWEKREGLPVHRLMHEKCGTVYAYTRELDAWRESKDQRMELQEPEKPHSAPEVVPRTQLGLRLPEIRRRWRYGAGVLLIIALIAGALAGMTRRKAGGLKPERGSPSSVPDSAIGPGESRSPDGKRIAFSSQSPNQGSLDLYVRSAESGKPIRLTADPAPDHHPAWSPDGSWIAFLRDVNEFERAILVIPATGGNERELARVSIATVKARSFDWPLLSWSADGKWLFTVDPETANARAYALSAASHASAETTP